jgi:hypothetical protein
MKSGESIFIRFTAESGVPCVAQAALFRVRLSSISESICVFRIVASVLLSHPWHPSVARLRR